jgi:hypothetical protein
MAGISNDPFEEFEFRPINEGLGFHSKQKAQQSPTKTSTQSHAAAGATSTQFNVNRPTNTSFTAPLPRHDNSNSRQAFQIPTIEDDSIAKAQTAVNEILKNLNQKRHVDFVNENEKYKVELKKSKPFFFAATLDAMLILAAFLMSMIVMLTITKVDLFMNLSNSATSRLVYLATAGLFLSITFIYMVVNRAFLGFTPGEWAFDQRCGGNDQMNSLTYIPRLALRTVIVMLTGFVITPVLSYLFNKDVAGNLVGVTLFRKPNA